MAPPPLVSVVDDDESVREALPDLLREAGYSVNAFASAEEFLASDCVRETRCLIVDIAMPGMNGPDLQQQLNDRRQGIPIVFITGQADEGLRPRVLAQGAVECLFKPFSESALLRALTAALRPSWQPDGQMAESPPIVFIVDDDISVRESLELLIRSAGWDARTFPTARSFLTHGRVHVPSCLVLDVSLPDLSGLDLQREIAKRWSDLPIIFITGHGDVPMSVEAMKAGAVEFLLKPFDSEVLLRAIERAIERNCNALRLETEMRSLRERFATLTGREQQVMLLVAAGFLNKQVGAELGISEITVKAHRGKAMRKMNARSFAELVNMAGRLSAEQASSS